MKRAFEIKTESDLQMSVQIVECTNGNIPDVFRTNEVGFIIHGYDPKSDNEVEQLVTISQNEAGRLIKILELLTYTA